MHRATFRDIKASRVPFVLGECASNSPGLASYVNEAIQRLIQAGGDTGWFGSWAKMAFTVTPSGPFITTPREVARIINMDVCNRPIRIQNEFYEFLEFGRGLKPNCIACSPDCCGINIQAYDRGFVPTMTDLTAGSQIRVYPSNAADVGTRIFIDAVDSNGQQIYTIDNGVQVSGFFMTLALPFVTSPMALNVINGIQKDTTLYPVSVYQVNPTTSAITLLAKLAPDESSPSYRRYYLDRLPANCCNQLPGTPLQVTAMAKLEFIPVKVDTDYLIINNIPAIKEECMSIRYEEMDNPQAKQQSQFHHIQAIRLLNRELQHFEGKEMPAILFSPFGNASLNKVDINMI